MSSRITFFRPVGGMAGLALRNLSQARTRTLFSILAVALGVAMVMATGLTASSIHNTFSAGNVMAPFIEVLNTMGSAIGGVISAAAGFLVFNAFAMSLTQRQQQIGAMRALGMTHRQVLRLVLFEALSVGVIGTALGLVSGPLLAQMLVVIVRQIGLELGKSEMPLSIGAAAVAVGLGVPMLSAYFPARQAAQTSPLAVLGSQQVAVSASHADKNRFRLGLVIAVALLTYLVVAPPGRWTGANPPWEWIMVFILESMGLIAFGLCLPPLVTQCIEMLRRPVISLAAINGRLTTDNLRRAPQRVMLTALTFTIGLAVVIGVSGMVSFNNKVLIVRGVADLLNQNAWWVSPLDSTIGVAQLMQYEPASFRLDPEIIKDIRQSVSNQALVTDSYMVSILDFGSPIPGFPSVIMDVRQLTYPGGYSFVDGNWETALPIMDRGCGILTTPNIARQHGIRVGDQVRVPGIGGAVECTLAGTGAGGVTPVTIISLAAKDKFVLPDRPPDTLNIRPLPGADTIALARQLRQVTQRYPGKAFLMTAQDQLDGILKTADQMMGMFNALILLAELTAAFGMINTTVMNINERRHELGLLRAIGATRKQIIEITIGEAVIVAVIGAVTGALLGISLTVIYALSYGGLSFGIPDLPLWESAGAAVIPAFLSGLPGLIAAPLLAAGAAYFPIRSILQGTSIEMLRSVQE